MESKKSCLYIRDESFSAYRKERPKNCLREVALLPIGSSVSAEDASCEDFKFREGAMRVVAKVFHDVENAVFVPIDRSC